MQAVVTINLNKVLLLLLAVDCRTLTHTHLWFAWQNHHVDGRCAAHFEGFQTLT